MTVVQKSGIIPPNQKMPVPFHSFQFVSHLTWSPLPTFLSKLHKSLTEFIFCHRVEKSSFQILFIPSDSCSLRILFPISNREILRPDTVNVSVARCPSFVNVTFLNVWGTIISPRTYWPLSTLLGRVSHVIRKQINQHVSIIINFLEDLPWQR